MRIKVTWGDGSTSQHEVETIDLDDTSPEAAREMLEQELGAYLDPSETPYSPYNDYTKIELEGIDYCRTCGADISKLPFTHEGNCDECQEQTTAKEVAEQADVDERRNVTTVDLTPTPEGFASMARYTLEWAQNAIKARVIRAGILQGDGGFFAITNAGAVYRIKQGEGWVYDPFMGSDEAREQEYAGVNANDA